MRRVLLVFVLLLSATAQTDASDPVASDFEAKLRAADEAKSYDPLKFMELLSQLQSEAGHANALQRQQLEYLQAFKTGVYEDQIAKGAEIARQLFDETRDPTLKYRAGGLIASFSAINRDLSTGLRYIQKTMALRSKVPDRNIRHEGIINGALLYAEIGQYRISLRYAEEVLGDNPGPRMQCMAGQHRILAQFELGLLPKDNATIERAIERCSALRESIPTNIARSVLARKFAAEGDPAKAVTLLESTLPDVRATRYPRLIAGFHAQLAELKLKLGDPKAAESHAREAVALSEHIPSSSALVSAYNTLYKIAATREKSSVSLDLYKRYAEAEMAHQNDVRARELAYEIVFHETRQQSQQIALLERSNQVLRLQQALERESVQKAQMAIVFLVLLLVFLMLTFALIFIVVWAVPFKRLAETDMLTRLSNRRFFTKQSERALAKAARAGNPVALIMFDLDHFKAINDTCGHDAGDWVLEQAGKICSARRRKADFLGRIGGEEFAVLLCDADLTTAARIAEDYRAELARIDTREIGHEIEVTASFGVSWTGQSGYALSRLLSDADRMMYRAKTEGRNRVYACAAEGPQAGSSTSPSPPVRCRPMTRPCNECE